MENNFTQLPKTTKDLLAYLNRDDEAGWRVFFDVLHEETKDREWLPAITPENLQESEELISRIIESKNKKQSDNATEEF